jgi:type IV fimbrial biogenesis protein FimT
MNKRINPPCSGLGLVEILIAIAVVGILAALAAPSMAGFMERRRIIAVTNEVADVINFARLESRANNFGTTIYMQSDPQQRMSCLAVTKANTTHVCKCYESGNVCSPGFLNIPFLRKYQLFYSDSSIRISAGAASWDASPNHPGNGSLTFEPNYVIPSASGVKLRVAGTLTGAALTVSVEDSGFIKICSNVGQLGGYKAC